MKINIYILLIILLSALSLNAQLSTYEKPPSYSMKSELLKYDDKNIKVMPPIDLAKLLEEDKEEEAHGLPPRFGFKHKVSLNTENSGQWYKLDDGRRMWRLKISCPGAKSINLLYDKFWLPEGGKFFIYNADKRQCIGAFTTINNKGDRKEPRGFATELVVGEESVLEYYTPKEQTEEAIISIDYVVQGYKRINVLNNYKDENKLQNTSSQPPIGYEAPSCCININCPRGAEWQTEKNAVALMVVENEMYASGFLVNNTRNDRTPYFLTARHCITTQDRYPIPVVQFHYDAETNPNMDRVIFYWNYERQGCDNEGGYPRYTTSGATVLANTNRQQYLAERSDFALLKLTEDPALLPDEAQIYFLGWDRRNIPSQTAVCISHPVGDVKKIAFAIGPIMHSIRNGNPWNSSSTDLFWAAYWSDYVYNVVNGMPLQGSSGSPLINSDHRVVGILFGGYTSCTVVRPLHSPCSPSYFGKFGVAWTGNNFVDIRRRINHWLDPDNTGVEVLDGINRCSQTVINYDINSDKNIHCNKVTIHNCTIQNSAKVTINTKKLVIENNFILNSGNRFEVNLDLPEQR